ncbi:putative transmembrane protein [Enhygromyxa salina]|uniref:Putative transmembrane protein n=1 Tax=Enhygromyxa salina TaxID=215803 RepID=A0A0C2D2K0_9BACT|nr:YeeE/YedE family protein [Enhygromyxa salina]KIG14352.1 putative transmembrane protein [Enhygromyxa salina]
MVTEFTPLAALIGGALIGLASALMLAFNGRIAGISGIVGGLLQRSDDRTWRGMFLIGMLLGGVVLQALVPGMMLGAATSSLPLLAVAGLLVGFGTRMGGGCTSGHGVCGISRLSTRSLIATATFMVSAGLTVWILRHVVGGLS